MLKLKLQDFGHLMRRVDSLEKTLMLGGIGGKRRRGRQRMRGCKFTEKGMGADRSNSVHTRMQTGKGFFEIWSQEVLGGGAGGDLG